MLGVRSPAVAGTFYPRDPQELRATIASLLTGAGRTAAAPKALIAPHAGYAYSGPIAASAFALLERARGDVTRVVLIGPSHFVPLRGLALPGADRFTTPLGDVPLDRSSIASLAGLPQVSTMDSAHAREHSLEVQLPLLQVVLGPFTLVPLVTGRSAPQEVGEVLEKLWGGPETLVVVSSDLSHHHDAFTARRMDEDTSKAIESLRHEDIDNEAACGHVAVCGLLHVARRRGLRASTIDLRNSGDTTGVRDRVVGYGAYAFH